MSLTSRVTLGRLRQARFDAARYARGPSEARREIRRGWFFSLARSYCPYVVAAADEGLFVLPTDDRVIGRLSFVHEPFELGTVTGLEDALRTAGAGRIAGPAGRTVLEIGGNIGTTTIPLITVLDARRVITLEPMPRTAEILGSTVALNGLGDRVEVHRLGLSDSEGTVTFEVSPSNSGDARIRTGHSASNVALQGEEGFALLDVPVTTFDAFAAESLDLDDVGLVWIDVQGHEAHVLAGASTLLERDIPVVAEYWPYGLRRAGALERFEDIVRGHYAVVFDLARGVGLPASEIATLRDVYREHYHDTNLLLVKAAE